MLEKTIVVNTIATLRDRLEREAIREDNLFHSFREFNVGERASVNFANPAGVRNLVKDRRQTSLDIKATQRF